MADKLFKLTDYWTHEMGYPQIVAAAPHMGKLHVLPVACWVDEGYLDHMEWWDVFIRKGMAGTWTRIQLQLFA